MIKLVIFDVDGVLTDGTVQVDESGHEYKRVNLNDIDTLNQIVRDGIHIAAITGERGCLVDYFSGKVLWKYFVKGCKKKLETFQSILKEENCSLDEVVYIGDGMYDVPVLKYATKSVCPANAIPAARAVAQVHLSRSGGNGCVVELYELIKSGCI